MEIRPATGEDAQMLSDLAYRAKAHWGYDDAFMAACRAELTYTAEQLDAGGFWVLEDADEVRGFYGLTKVSPDAVELEAMFVEPAHLGRGYGRALMDHATAEFHAMDLARLVIQADPNAASFYEAAGATQIGARPSDSIDGRTLPLYEIVNDDIAHTAGEANHG